MEGEYHRLPYQGQGVTLEWGNYRGLKLLDKVMNVLGRVAENFLQQQVRIDDIQFMPWRSTTDTIFIVCQLQEKFHAVNKILHMAFVNLEKTFERVPKHVIWWDLSKLSIEEWLMWFIQSMYERIAARVGCNLGEGFSVKVGVHQGSCLSPLLFIAFLKALSQGFRTGCPLGNLYTEDLAITVSLGELQEKLILWKTNIEGKGLRVNIGKNNVLVSGQGLNGLQKSGKDPCGMCLKGVGTNPISMEVVPVVSTRNAVVSLVLWRLIPVSSVNGVQEARPIDGTLMTDIILVWEKLRWCHPCVTLRAPYPQIMVVNSLLSQDAVSHGAYSTSSYPSPPPAHFPSPPEIEFTIRLTVMPCSMQAEPGPQFYLICIACKAMAELWFAGCAVSPQRTKSAHRNSWRGCSLTIWQRYSTPADSDGMVMKNVVMVGWRKIQKLNPTGGRGRGHPKKTWTEMIDMDCLALGLRPILPTGKLGVVELEVQSDPTLSYTRD